MWNFMKPKCPATPPPNSVQEIKRELVYYKQLLIAEMQAHYERICEALSVTEPSDLEALHGIIVEYQTVLAAMNGKMELLQQLNADALAPVLAKLEALEKRIEQLEG